MLPALGVSFPCISNFTDMICHDIKAVLKAISKNFTNMTIKLNWFYLISDLSNTKDLLK